MNKKKRLVIIAIVVIIGAILLSSGTLQIHPGKLVEWFSSVGKDFGLKPKNLFL